MLPLLIAAALIITARVFYVAGRASAVRDARQIAAMARAEVAMADVPAGTWVHRHDDADPCCNCPECR
jgi:hypothetical protein